MTTIFLIAAFNGLFFALLLLSKQKKALHDIILAALLSLLGFYTGIYGITRDYLFHDYPLLSVLLISLLLLPGPFLYLYLLVIASGRSRFKYSDCIHFIPISIFVIYLGVAALFPLFAAGINMDHIHYDTDAPLLFNLFLIITALSGPFYFLLIFKLFRRHEINIFNNYSSRKDIDLNWLKKLALVFGIAWTALMIIAVIHHLFSLFSLSFCTDGLSLTLSVFIIWIGWFGIRQKEIFYSFPDGEKEFITESAPKYIGSGINSETTVKMAAQLDNLMNSEKPYLDSELTLPKLAGMLNVPSHHLSRTINEQLNVNFFDLINRYRVEEVKSRINDPSFKQLTILGIAMDCGFNSKSAFNRLFKKFTGYTPTEFKSRSATNASK